MSSDQKASELLGPFVRVTQMGSMYREPVKEEKRFQARVKRAVENVQRYRKLGNWGIR